MSVTTQILILPGIQSLGNVKCYTYFQVVIKSLETNYKRIEGLSGATILGNGDVALILDVAGLLKVGLDPQHISSMKTVMQEKVA